MWQLPNAMFFFWCSNKRILEPNSIDGLEIDDDDDDVNADFECVWYIYYGPIITQSETNKHMLNKQT